MAQSPRTIDIKEFIDEQKTRSLVCGKSCYYIAPNSVANKGGRRVRNPSTVNIQDKAYSLLVKVLHDKKKAAIGKVVLRSEREHLVAIRAYQKED